MAQQNKMEISNRIVSNHRSHRSTVTTLEKLAPETIFDYLTANQIYFSSFGLNSRMNKVVYNTPSIPLDLSHPTTKFYRIFQRIFSG